MIKNWIFLFPYLILFYRAFRNSKSNSQDFKEMFFHQNSDQLIDDSPNRKNQKIE